MKHSLSQLYHSLCLSCLLLLTACQGLPVASSLNPAETLWQTDSPPTILDSRNHKQLNPAALLPELLKADVIYLGEEHDNPHHHQIQLAVLQQLLQHGKKPLIGFEFFSREQTPWLMHYTVGKPSSLPIKQPLDPDQQLRVQLGWEKREDWSYYFPLLQLARQQHLTIFGADLPEGLRLRLTREGLQSLTPLERSLWRQTPFQHADYQQLMRDKLAQAHCGMASESLLDRLYETWLARNEAMAQSIVAMSENNDSPIVIIVGAGHVTHNMGIYERVHALRPQLRQLNLGLISGSWEEFVSSLPLPTLHIGSTSFLPAHEMLWLTPASAESSDHCAAWSKAKADKPAQQ
ncbi:ChaN family lipoprotein [Candidatus Magnetaquicoccus inordinatus]|uniref:ChaN family lipoprotein n=1 Tax=Candidatus Magnetaquicoccus inordinatus TaxID=2496818 RepID=UPI00102B02DA|nr:ChaN family lipoprotein [Candidatus Magnetaquicoccus inordinatus]